MPKNDFNHTIEDYLRAIYRVEERDGQVSNAALSKELGVSAAAASEMVQKLSQQRWVKYQKYRGASLTKKGRDRAIVVTRRHRLWEVFLIEQLNFEWDQVHEYADQLEHIQGGHFVDRLDDYLGNPTHDPHGDPIPARDGTIPERNLIAVSAMKVGQSGSVERVMDEIPELLRYAASLGLEIGSVLRVTEHITFDASVRLELASGEQVISQKLASSIFVEERIESKERG